MTQPDGRQQGGVQDRQVLLGAHKEGKSSDSPCATVKKKEESFAYYHDKAIMTFLSGSGRNLTDLVFSFKLGVKVWERDRDLRDASKATLLKVELELGAEAGEMLRLEK